MTGQATKVLRMTRRFDASPEQVFDAWIKPDVAARWLFTSLASESHSTELDAVVGGKWTISDTRDGVVYAAMGEYLEIDRPRRLVFSFGMPRFDPGFARVIVEIAPNGDDCMLTLAQEDVPPAAERGLRQGWSEMFDAMARLFQPRLPASVVHDTKGYASVSRAPRSDVPSAGRPGSAGDGGAA